MTDFYNGVHNAYHEAKERLFFAEREHARRVRLFSLSGTAVARSKWATAGAALFEAQDAVASARATVSPEAARSIDAKFEERARSGR